LKTVDISNNNIPFSDDLFTSMCAIKKVMAEGSNYSSIMNPCLKVLCEKKVLEAESIGKIDLHSKKLTGQLLIGLPRDWPLMYVCACRFNSLECPVQPSHASWCDRA
jgi:hypothetical protein